MLSDNAIVKRRLPCNLTDMEMADAAMLAATRQAEYDKVEEEKKRVLGRYTGRLKSLRGQMSTESQKATTGIEERSVECMWIVDRSMNTASLRRSDTGEVVQERELTDREKQLSMMELAQWLEETAEAPATVSVDEDADDDADAPEVLETAEGSDEGDGQAPTADALGKFLDEEPAPGEAVKWADCPSCKGLMQLKASSDGGATAYVCGCGYKEWVDSGKAGANV